MSDDRQVSESVVGSVAWAHSNNHEETGQNVAQEIKKNMAASLFTNTRREEGKNEGKAKRGPSKMPQIQAF